MPSIPLKTSVVHRENKNRNHHNAYNVECLKSKPCNYSVLCLLFGYSQLSATILNIYNTRPFYL